MRRLSAIVGVCFVATIDAAHAQQAAESEPAATEAAPGAPGDGSASAPDAPPSLVLKEEGLSFDVLLPRGRSLKERDPRLDRLIEGLPELGSDAVPFEKGWTESLADSFKDQLVNGPRPCQPNRCEERAVIDRRLQQMNTDLGPQDDWTWTPPAGY